MYIYIYIYIYPPTGWPVVGPAAGARAHGAVLRPPGAALILAARIIATL